MILFNYKCPVCKNVCQVGGRIRSWFRNAEEAILGLKVVLSPKQRVAGDSLLCSEECEAKYLDAKRQANEAYDGIMADYQ